MTVNSPSIIVSGCLWVQVQHQVEAEASGLVEERGGESASALAVRTAVAEEQLQLAVGGQARQRLVSADQAAQEFGDVLLRPPVFAQTTPENPDGGLTPTAERVPRA